MPTRGREVLIPCRPRVGSTASQCLCHPQHHGKADYRAVRYFERVGGHIHTTFVTVHCHNCSILLLVIIVNLLPRWLDKLNLIIDVCVQGRAYSIQGWVLSVVSGIPRGSQNVSLWIRGTAVHHRTGLG